MEKSSHLFGAGHIQDPIERPHSTVSMATEATSTSVNESLFDDGLSSVTTPRGNSPVHFGNSNSELPPSYDESQAQHLDRLEGERESPHHQIPGAWPHQPDAEYSDVQVYRTELPPGPIPPISKHDSYSSTNRSTETLHPNLGESRASALLSQALAFTAAPAAAANGITAHLVRPIAIPELPSPHASPVRFARLYSRTLQTSTTITPSQLAAFLDGLNAVSKASAFSAHDLHGSTPFRFSVGREDANIPREEWVRAYVQLSKHAVLRGERA